MNLRLNRAGWREADREEERIARHNFSIEMSLV